uniref:Uncharacterized protein n=1 Tax=Arundo donax TaxID=35708 RepID=A0A0A9AAV5_ARUDO
MCCLSFNFMIKPIVLHCLVKAKHIYF